MQVTHGRALWHGPVETEALVSCFTSGNRNTKCVNKAFGLISAAPKSQVSDDVSVRAVTHEKLHGKY